MNKTMIVAATVAALALSGCSSKKPSKANFKKALDAYLAENGQACLAITQWPVVVSVDGRGPMLRYTENEGEEQMQALAKAGLVESRQVNTPASFMRPAGRALEYSLTKKGQAALRKESGREARGRVNDLCFARVVVDEVVRWNEPNDRGPYTMTEVTYTYKLRDVAGWAKSDDVQQAFPDLRRMLRDAGSVRQEHAMRLTSDGWIAYGME